MSWMNGHEHLAADGLMPGMATPAQMTKLQTLHGKALDIVFLQLMIRHHQGGVAMAQYAAAHATQPYVRAARLEHGGRAEPGDHPDGTAAAPARRGPLPAPPAALTPGFVGASRWADC